MSDQLQRNFREDKINTLCHTLSSTGTCEVVCFQAAKPLDAYLNDFYIISYTSSSDLFNRFWRQKLTEIHQIHHSISFNNVHGLVWKPVFQSCVELLDKLRSGNMKLSDVDCHFKGTYGDRLSDLSRDLKSLDEAVSSITHSSSSISWIPKVVQRIKQYWALCGYREAAEAFIKIRDTLKLTGDFSLVEKVAQQVIMATCMCTLSRKFIVFQVPETFL